MTTAVTDRSAERSLEILSELFGDHLGRDFGVRLWDGTDVAPPNAPFVLNINAPYALRAALTPPLDLNPQRAFVEGWLDVVGNLEAAIDSIERSANALTKLTRLKVVTQLARLPAPPRGSNHAVAHLRGKRHTKSRDAEAIGFHYDQPTEFYRAFLGGELVYSCAYWSEGVTSLEAAQLAKLDYILDKLRLQPGQHFLDVGCGWGALVIRAAQRGAVAHGITLSRRQYEEAQRLIEAAGVKDRATVELRDYRDLGDATFDAIASVGMVEHVGRERLAEYFDCAFRALRDGGLFLNHGIVQQGRDGKGYRAADDFVGRYVFPDGDLVPIDATVRFGEAAGFEVRDIENLREHYARTLRAWVANLVANQGAAVAATDERTERIWRIYMAGSARGFALGRMGLMQTLFAKPRTDGSVDVPATRRASPVVPGR